MQPVPDTVVAAARRVKGRSTRHLQDLRWPSEGGVCAAASAFRSLGSPRTATGCGGSGLVTSDVSLDSHSAAEWIGDSRLAVWGALSSPGNPTGEDAAAH